MNKVGCSYSLLADTPLFQTPYGVEHLDLRCCGVADFFWYSCTPIKSHTLAVISNCAVCGVSDFKPTVFGETKLFVDPLLCCDLS